MCWGDWMGKKLRGRTPWPPVRGAQGLALRGGRGYEARRAVAAGRARGGSEGARFGRSTAGGQGGADGLVRQGLGAVLLGTKQGLGCWVHSRAHSLQHAGCPRLCRPQGGGCSNTHSLQCTKPTPNRPPDAHLRARRPAAWGTARGMHCGGTCKVTGWGGDEGWGGGTVVGRGPTGSAKR